MSTKTNFKRIALVAVAALGAGVLSVAPANAGAVAAGNATSTPQLPNLVFVKLLTVRMQVLLQQSF